MEIKGSQRLEQMGSAIFAEVAQWKAEAVRQGRDVIDLGIGSPDQPPSERVIRALEQAVRNPRNYGYPSSEGTLAFRQSVAAWYRHRFGVVLDPADEITTLMGSQDGLAHLAMALLDPGDTAIVPDPGYPIYAAGLVMAGVTPCYLQLRAENDFLPRFEDIPAETAVAAKLMILNYPSNPLSAVADRAFFEKAVAFAKANRILIAHDLAYSEMAFDGLKPISILEVEGAKEVAVEFHSLSKSFNMAGCRIAFMVGHKDAVHALRRLKGSIDYGIFLAVQEAGIAALKEDLEREETVAGFYQKRRDLFIAALRQAGWDLPLPKATMFLWAPVPRGWTSRQISREILANAGVVVIPGDAFGAQGEGYVRIALVQEEPVLLEAAARLGRFMKHLKKA